MGNHPQYLRFQGEKEISLYIPWFLSLRYSSLFFFLLLFTYKYIAPIWQSARQCGIDNGTETLQCVATCTNQCFRFLKTTSKYYISKYFCLFFSDKCMHLYLKPKSGAKVQLISNLRVAVLLKNFYPINI